MDPTANRPLGRSSSGKIAPSNEDAQHRTDDQSSCDAQTRQTQVRRLFERDGGQRRHASSDLRPERSTGGGTKASSTTPPALSARSELRHATADHATTHLTPLIQAAANGQLVEVIILLSEGQEVDARDGFSCTALMYAVCGGYERIVERLLQKGAGVDCQDQWFWTPLMYAAYTGDEKIVHRLLDKEANYLLRNMAGLTAAQIALQNGHVQLGDLLHRHEMGAAEVAALNQALGRVTTTANTAAATTTTTCTTVTTITSTTTQSIVSTSLSTFASAPAGAPAPAAPALSAQDYAVGMLGLVGGAVQVAGGVAATLYSGPAGVSLGPALVSSGTSSLIYTARTLLYQGKALDMDTYIKEAGIGAVTGMVMPNLSKAGGVAIGWAKANDVLAAGVEVLGKGIEAVGAQGAKLLGGTVVQAANTLGQGAVQGTAGNLVNSVASAAVYWSESDDQQKQALKRRVKDSVSAAAVLRSASVVGMGAIIQQAGVVGSAAVSRLGASLPEQAVAQVGQLESQLAEKAPTAWDYVRNAMAAGGKAVATDTGMAGASKLAENVWNEGSLAGASEGVADSIAEAARESLVSSVISGTSQAMIETFKTSRRQQLLREMKQSQLEAQASLKEIDLATEEVINRWKTTQEAKRQLEEAQDVAAKRQHDLLAAEAVLVVREESVRRAAKKVEKLARKLDQAEQVRSNPPNGGLASKLLHDQNMLDRLSRLEEGIRQWKAVKKECEQHRASVLAPARDDFQLSQQRVTAARQALENENMKAAPASVEPFHRAIEAYAKSSVLWRTLNSLDSNRDPTPTPLGTPRRRESQFHASTTSQAAQGAVLESWHVVALAVATLDRGAGASSSSSNSSQTQVIIHFPPQAWLAEAQRSGTHLNQLVIKQGWLVQGAWVKDRNRDDALQLRMQMPDLMAACDEYAQRNLQLLAASGVTSTGEDRLVHAWLAQTLGAARAGAVLREELQDPEATRLLVEFVGPDAADDWIRRYPSPASACRAWLIGDARRRLKL